VSVSGIVFDIVRHFKLLMIIIWIGVQFRTFAPGDTSTSVAITYDNKCGQGLCDGLKTTVLRGVFLMAVCSYKYDSVCRMIWYFGLFSS
jgi:hypothetical protein